MPRSSLAARAVVGSAIRIYVGTAVLGLVAETLHRHVSGAPEPTAHGPLHHGGHTHGAPHAHGDAHEDHQGHRHTSDGGCENGACSTGHVSFSGGRLSLTHDTGPFTYVLNGLGGVAAALEGRRLARRMGGPGAGATAAAAGALAAVVHAGTHIAFERGDHDIVETVTSPCHRRLLAASVAGATLGALRPLATR